ncbi:hypothetical protein Fot_41964 [Forsythia ovata]|uniref:Uncharacterized protein n=1 Tax=Forsythia ovata TaxID=205694 RepID=A0ABD1RJV9_9LAMI
MGTLGSSLLPKIGLAGLAAKKIPPVVKKESSNNDQKKILTSLSLNGGEKNQDAPPTLVDPRQTHLAPTASSQGLKIMAQKQEVGVKIVETIKERCELSSRTPVDEDDDVEVLEDPALTRKAKKP